MIGAPLMSIFFSSSLRSMILTTKSASFKNSAALSFTTDVFACFSNTSCFMTPSRTVAICGRTSGQMIVAMMLPPKAGRICIRLPFSSMSRAVQSAVRPQRRYDATLGPRSRPTGVAPKSTEYGFSRSMSLVITLKCGNV